MKLIIIRHFKPKIDKNIPVTDWTLDEKTIKEMKETIKNINFNKITKIYTSPQKKAIITAEYISEKYNIPLVIEENIRETDRNNDYIEGDFKETIKKYFLEDNIPKWEKQDDVKKRINVFLEKIKSEKGSIIIISHGRFLSIMLHKYFNKDVVDFWQNLNFGEIIEVDFKLLEESYKKD